MIAAGLSRRHTHKDSLCGRLAAEQLESSLEGEREIKSILDPHYQAIGSGGGDFAEIKLAASRQITSEASRDDDDDDDEGQESQPTTSEPSEVLTENSLEEGDELSDHRGESDREEDEGDSARVGAQLDSTRKIPDLPENHPEREYFSDPDFHDERPAVRPRRRRQQSNNRARTTSRSLDQPGPHRGRISRSESSDEEAEQSAEKEEEAEEVEEVKEKEEADELEVDQADGSEACAEESPLTDTDRETVLSVNSRRADGPSSGDGEESTLGETPQGKDPQQASELDQSQRSEAEADSERTDDQVSCQWTASEACAEFFEDECTLADDDEEDDDEGAGEREEQEQELDLDDGEDEEEGGEDNEETLRDDKEGLGGLGQSSDSEPDECSQPSDDELQDRENGSTTEKSIDAAIDAKVPPSCLSSESQSGCHDDDEDEEQNEQQSPRRQEEETPKVKLPEDFGSGEEAEADLSLDFPNKSADFLLEYCRDLVDLVHAEAREQVEIILTLGEQILSSSMSEAMEAQLRRRQTDLETTAFSIETMQQDTQTRRPEEVAALSNHQEVARQQSDETTGSTSRSKTATTTTTRRHIYTSSMFYHDARSSYPTLEQQVDRCQAIARQLETSCHRRTEKEEAIISISGETCSGTPAQPSADRKASLMFRRRRERMRHYTISSPYNDRHTNTTRSRALRRWNSELLVPARARAAQSASPPPQSRRRSTDQNRVDSLDEVADSELANSSSSAGSLTDTEYEAPLVGRRRRCSKQVAESFSPPAQSCADVNQNRQQQQQPDVELSAAAAASKAKYRPFLDATTLKDIERLRAWCPKVGFNEHQSVSPEVCKMLVSDLTSRCVTAVSDSSATAATSQPPPPTTRKSRGAILFEQRQLQSSDWIVGGPGDQEDDHEITSGHEQTGKQLVEIDAPTLERPPPPTIRLRDERRVEPASEPASCEDEPQEEQRHLEANLSKSRLLAESTGAALATPRLSRPSIGEETVMVAEQEACAEAELLLELTPVVMAHQQPRLELATITKTPSFGTSARHVIPERDQLSGSLSRSTMSEGEDESGASSDSSSSHQASYGWPLGRSGATESAGTAAVAKQVALLSETRATAEYLDEAAEGHRALVWSNSTAAPAPALAGYEAQQRRPASAAGRLLHCQQSRLPRTQYAAVKFFAANSQVDRLPQVVVPAIEVTGPTHELESRGNSPAGGAEPRAQSETRTLALAWARSTQKFDGAPQKGDAAAGTLRTADSKRPHHCPLAVSGIPVNEQRHSTATATAIDDERGREDDDDERAAQGILLPILRRTAAIASNESTRVCCCECTCGAVPRATTAAIAAADKDNHAAWKWSQRQKQQQQQQQHREAGLLHSRPLPCSRLDSLRHLKQQQQQQMVEPLDIAAAAAVPTRRPACRSRGSSVVPQHAQVERAGRWSQPRDFAPTTTTTTATTTTSADQLRQPRAASPRPTMGQHRNRRPNTRLAGAGPPAASGADTLRVGVPVSLAPRWSGGSGSEDGPNDLSTATTTLASLQRQTSNMGFRYFQAGQRAAAPAADQVPYWRRVNGICAAEADGSLETFGAISGRATAAAARGQIRTLRVCVRTPREAHRIFIERRPATLRHSESRRA